MIHQYLQALEAKAFKAKRRGLVRAQQRHEAAIAKALETIEELGLTQEQVEKLSVDQFRKAFGV